MTLLRLALAASLMLATAAEASAACNIRSVSGTYEVQITRIDHHLLQTTFGTCWFEVSRFNRTTGNLRITCDEGDPQFHGYFGLSDAYGETTPWHQLKRVRGRSDIPRGVQTIAPCRWEIIDRNGVEGLTYDVTISTDGQSLIGRTTGYHWLSRAELTFVMNGVRQ